MTHFVEKVEYLDREIHELSPEIIRELVLQLSKRNDPDLGLSLIGHDDQCWLVVYYVPGYGFHVSGIGIGDTIHFTAVQPDLGDEIVDVWMAGSDDLEYLRCCFISEDNALRAVLEFYDFGIRAPAISWEAADAVMGPK